MESSAIPEELLAEIVEYSSSSISTLKNLSLTSKKFRRLAQPRIFRSYRCMCWEHGTKTRAFLRSLLENADLAAAVQNVALDCWTSRSAYENPFTNTSMTAPSAELAKLYNESLFPSFDSPSCLSQVYYDLCRGSEDAEILLLLLLCPNISTLEFKDGRDLGTGSYIVNFLNHQLSTGKFNPTMKPGKRILNRLTHLKFAFADTEGYTSLEDIYPIFALPTLQRLDGELVDVALNHENFVCNITEAYFSMSLFDVEGLTGFLQACPKLEILDFWAGGVCQGDCSEDFSGVGNALRRYGTSLKRLTFDARGAYFEGSEWRDLNGSKKFGSLKELNKLEYLEIPIQHLVDVGGSRMVRLDDVSIPDIYRTLQDEVLPSSCTELAALNFSGGYDEITGRVKGLEKSVDYQGTHGETLKLHICRNNSHGPNTGMWS